MEIEKRQEDFIKKSSTNKHVEVIGEYVNAHTEVLCKCVYCGDMLKMRPDRIYNNCMHQKCKNVLTANIRKERGYKKLVELVGDRIEFTTEYISSIKPIGCKCKKCGYEFSGHPNNLIKGSGCAKCFYKSRMKTNEDFLIEIKEMLNSIEILGEYCGDDSKIRCRCKRDGYIWETLPRNLINGHGCPMCSKNARYDLDYFIAKLKTVNPDITIVGNYINSRTHLNCLCNLCGYEWCATPNNLLNGKGCPHCNTSNAEKRIKNYLNDKSISFEFQKKYDGLVGLGGKKLSYDFYLPNYNLLIEAQGEQHYIAVDFFGGQQQFKTQQEHDRRKRIYAKENNIQLIEIPYFDFENIEILLDKFLLTKKGGQYVRRK